MKRLFFLLGFLTVLGLLVGGSVERRVLPGRQSDGSWLVSTGQAIRPAGRVLLTEGSRPKDAALDPSGRYAAVLGHRRVSVVTASEGALVAEADMAAGPAGIAWSPDSATIYACAEGGRVYPLAFDAAAKTLTLGAPISASSKPGGQQPSGAAVVGGRLYVSLSIANRVVEIDRATGAILRTFETDACPERIAASPDGSILAVSCRGGRALNEASPLPSAESAGTRVQIDPGTDAAAKGSVALVSLADGRVRTAGAGRQPSGLCFLAGGRTLAVADSDSDTVTLVDAALARVSQTISLKPAGEPLFGMIPTDVAASPDGRTLYVSLGGLNAVEVVSMGTVPRLMGLIPAGWFPIAVEASPGGSLIVASSKGIGSRPSAKTTKFGVHDSVGMIQKTAVPGARALAEMTRAVRASSRPPQSLAARRGARPLPIPERVGEPSVFRHVVYIIKENLTYDIVLGDMKEGNGDPSLCVFPESVTPNFHKLAREFVLLDNFYTSGTNSADGHYWTSGSIANGYTEQNYSANARSYPYDGGDPLAIAPTGFLWNAARRAGKTVRVYGEFVDRPRVFNPATGKPPTWTEAWEDYKSGAGRMVVEARTSQAALRPLLHPRFIGFPSIISDQWRADQFLGDLRQWEAKRAMPDLSILLLPNDHTSGTSPSMPTPRASVADNDLALGRIVEALSRSRFWKDTLILVVEDDSQLGVDHVDGHRTAAFCISPYTRRRQVVSDVYSHASMARTIGLVLGIPPMNRFDGSAVPLTACMTGTPSLAPFVAEPSRISLNEMNRKASALKGEDRRLALECLRQDLGEVDRAHARTLALAAWRSAYPDRAFPDRFYSPPGDQD